MTDTDQKPITVTLEWAEVLTVQMALQLLIEELSGDGEDGASQVAAAKSVLGKLEPSEI